LNFTERTVLLTSLQLTGLLNNNTSHLHLAWYMSQDCHIPHHNFYGTVGSEGSVTKDVEKNRT